MMGEGKARLKTCPFCGGEAEAWGYDSPPCWVGCNHCGAECSSYETVADAIAAWNRRPTQEPDDE